MTGFIYRGNTQVSFYICVDGFPERGFLYYSLREAIKEYRAAYNLKYKHINFIDMR